MKQKLLMLLVLLVSMTSANAQRSYTFNATALNVDGLPREISRVEINPDGKEAAGATELCGILANSGWGIVGFSEDFNFHSQLTAAPASTYYNFGEHGGSVSASAVLGGADTDGLGFACAKYLTITSVILQEIVIALLAIVNIVLVMILTSPIYPSERAKSFLTASVTATATIYFYHIVVSPLFIPRVVVFVLVQLNGIVRCA
jgi:hypothetical protein